MKQGDIYLIQWDISVGHEFQKARPAVILSSKITLKDSNLITFVAITKTTKSPINENILVKKNDTNRLMNDSLIKVHHISSFDKQRVIKYIGNVSEEILEKMKNYLKKHFDL